MFFSSDALVSAAVFGSLGKKARNIKEFSAEKL